MKIDKILEAYKTDRTAYTGNKITVYAPTNNGDRIVDMCCQFFKEKFGNYYSQLGEVVHTASQPSQQPDGTVAVFAYCNDDLLEQNIEALLTMLKNEKMERIFFDINGELFII